ncbi:hypothetical protein AJ79_01956 [Helicocarpus griseus UAMH5409]|uniref:FAD-binding PCMH-type domain-containing protein n=1 Tax=Helicocarpus griseus UAMH5409 TaxID=1447875 RepID=A0A2B7Y4Y0_9EURO|nr:hypothetical protein AJ79_01956 [Helicocarpus griseus UAMH5409]
MSSITRAPLTAELLSTLESRLVDTRVITKSSPDYQESIARWSDAAVKQAGAVLLPSTPEDISTILKFVQEHNIDFAVKGGGHSVSGASSSEDGIVIDLDRMRAVTVDTEKRIITAQGGAYWADVDTAAAKHGLATVGGTANHTGIGGLTLGGGFGWLSGRYGMVVDNLLSATLVLANGQIVTTSFTENPDLFWAVRGAGHNFGVAVKFQYRCYEQKNDIFSGLISFTPDKLESVVETLNTIFLEPQMDAAAICVLSRPPGAPVPMVSVLPFYNGPEEVARSHFKALFDLKPVVDQTAMFPYVKMNGLTNPMTTHGNRKTLKGTVFAKPLRPSFARSVLNGFTAKLQTDPDLAGSAIILEFYDMRKVDEVSNTSTAVANRSSKILNGVIVLRWKESSNDAKYREYGRQLLATFKDELSTRLAERNLTAEGVSQYMNYAEPGDATVSEIFGQNIVRLQQLKAQYDPNCIFDKYHAIKPISS